MPRGRRSDKLKRVVVYLPESTHRRLRAKLAAAGLSVSKWFRRLAERLIAGE